MEKPSGRYLLLRRLEGLVALLEDHEYRAVLWATAGARWLEQIDLSDVSPGSIRSAQQHIDDAHMALEGERPDRARQALGNALDIITRGPDV